MKKLIAIFLAATFLLLGACSANVSKGSIEPAVYRLEDEQYPRISLKDDGSFTIVYTIMATRMTNGTYTVEDGILKLAAEDGAEYCFEIKRDALVFDEDISTAFEKIYSDEPDIPDGAKFEFWRAYE